PRLRDERLGAATRLVRPADVRVRLAVVARDGVDDLVGNLRAAGAVEEGERLAQRGETGADGLDVQGDGGHAWDATTICAWVRRPKSGSTAAPDRVSVRRGT